MKRLLLAVIAMLSMWDMALMSYPGMYNPITGQIRCTDRLSCLHELGHKADHNSGWISQSKDWRTAVAGWRLFLYDHPEARDTHHAEIREYPGIGSSLWQETNPLTWSFWSGGWGGYREFYADCLMWYPTEEEMPVALRGFYDWYFIGTEMEIINGR